MSKVTNMDVAGAFLERELTSIKAQVYNVEYPPSLARSVFPIESTTASGAASVGYRTWDQVGQAKLVHGYQEGDLPNIEVGSKLTLRKISTLGAQFSYSLDEIENAQFAGQPLQQYKADATRDALMRLENTLAWEGDAAAGIPSFISNPNITQVTPVQGAAGQTDWPSKTAAEILADVNLMVASIRDATNGVESPDTLILPEAQYTLMADTPRSENSDMSLLDYVVKSSPFIKFVVPVYNLKDSVSSTDSNDCAMMFTMDRSKLWMETPMDVTFEPAQATGLKFNVPARSKSAGVIIAYPLSVCQLNGI